MYPLRITAYCYFFELFLAAFFGAAFFALFFGAAFLGAAFFAAAALAAALSAAAFSAAAALAAAAFSAAAALAAAAFSAAAIEYLHGHGVILIGIDTPSVDPFSSKDLPAHLALLRCGIANIEGLVLKHVPVGVYELSALPLALRDFDGSPVRAALRR